MTPVEIQTRIRVLEGELKIWREVLADKRCQTCVHFGAGCCALANGQVPPPDVQKTGCQAWAWDCIPF